MKFLKWTALLLGIPCLIVAGIVSYTSLKNANDSAKWLAKPQLPGVMYDIGGRRLYATVKGSGSPAVIIEAGLASSSPEWWHIQDELAKVTRVLTYDRAGYGWSDPGPAPRSGRQVIDDLNSLLQSAHVSGPYILVGHSIGGFYMQYFARAHPDLVSGVVLIEPFSEDMSRLKKELDPVIYSNLIDKTPTFRVVSFLAKLGIVRSLKVVPYIAVPDNIRNLIIENYSMQKTFTTIIEEYTRGYKLGAVQIRREGRFPPVPLTIIHHSREKYIRELLLYGLSLDEASLIENIGEDLQRKILRQSPKGRMIFSGTGGSNIHLEEPGIIITTVKKMILDIKMSR